jgi:hypothetical protein
MTENQKAGEKTETDEETGLPLQYTFWKRPLILSMKSATHSENNKGASLFSALISEYLGLESSRSPTWDRTRFQQTRGKGASGKRTFGER